MQPKIRNTVVAVTLITLLGCGGGYEDGEMADSGSVTPKMMAVDGADMEKAAGELFEQPPGSNEIGQAGEAAGQGDVEKIERQIIYTASLNLIVEDFSGVPEKVEALARKHGGIVSGSSLQGSSGSPRSGTWTIRVPVKQYGTFLEEANSLGEFQSLTTESQEVTAEYYDVQTRIKNKQKQETRLLTLLDEQTGKLEEVLKVEENLARVREEIERMQGRMRVLKDLTGFSTVTLHIDEIRGYEPPEAPTFGNRIARAWTGTLDALWSTAQNVVVGAVAVGPWLVVMAIPFVIFIGLIRMLVRRRTRR